MKNQEAMRIWVDALRSGEYEQGRLYLNDGQGKMCCLGVLCEVALKSGVRVSRGLKEYEPVVTYDNAWAAVPESVIEWSGVAALGSLDEPVEDVNHLSDLNDTRKYTFHQIADVIEDQFIV